MTNIHTFILKLIKIKESFISGNIQINYKKSGQKCVKSEKFSLPFQTPHHIPQGQNAFA